MKHFLPLLLCCAVWPVPAAEPTAVRFQRVVVDDKPPQSPWIKIGGDVDGDEKPDILLAPAELKGGTHRIAWYEAPVDTTAGDWKQHIIAEPVETVIHALAVADFDDDGKLDLAAAHMHQGKSPQEVVVYLNAGRGRNWRRQVIATTGSHDIVAADLDGDGRPDLLGANHGGPFQPVELWRKRGE